MAADLSDTNLGEADLLAATFNSSNFLGASFDAAKLHATVFADCDLSVACNLEKAKHNGPSTIGIDTILKYGGNIPVEFLRGAGVPEELIKEIPRLVGSVLYQSCFISYGEPDRGFAERLKDDLRTKGVNTWIYSMDATPGERTFKEIGQQRREAERFIVICSADSLVRVGVRKEIEEQLDEDPDKIIPISRDSLWKHPGFQAVGTARDLKPYLLERNYANFEEGADYGRELQRLLKALERNG